MNIFQKELIERITSEDYGHSLTDNINEAIYLLDDGTMISGDFYDGMRDTDHRMILSAPIFDDMPDYYDAPNTAVYWNMAHEYYKLVRLVPESSTALILEGQTLSKTQRAMLKQTEYELEIY